MMQQRRMDMNYNSILMRAKMKCKSCAFLGDEVRVTGEGVTTMQQ